MSDIPHQAPSTFQQKAVERALADIRHEDAYPVPQNHGSWQVEAWGSAPDLAKRVTAAGLRVLEYYQDELRGKPYALVNFMPPREPKPDDGKAQRLRDLRQRLRGISHEWLDEISDGHYYLETVHPPRRIADWLEERGFVDVGYYDPRYDDSLELDVARVVFKVPAPRFENGQRVVIRAMLTTSSGEWLPHEVYGEYHSYNGIVGGFNAHTNEHYVDIPQLQDAAYIGADCLAASKRVKDLELGDRVRLHRGWVNVYPDGRVVNEPRHRDALVIQTRVDSGPGGYTSQAIVRHEDDGSTETLDSMYTGEVELAPPAPESPTLEPCYDEDEAPVPSPFRARLPVAREMRAAIRDNALNVWGL